MFKVPQPFCTDQKGVYNGSAYPYKKKTEMPSLRRKQLLQTQTDKVNIGTKKQPCTIMCGAVIFAERNNIIYGIPFGNLVGNCKI